MPASLDLPGLRVLTCHTCRGRYVLSDFDAAAPYRCARCDRSLTHPSGSFDSLREASDPVYLYAVPQREGPTEPTGHMGRYELYEVLGRGGMGVVYRARDPELNRDVALKVLIAAEHADATQLDRFLREARAAARLDHPNVVRVLDIQRQGQQAFFTMDLVRGPSLADLVEELGRRPIREAVRIVIDVGRALHEAHKHDLLHRDVKPGNVMLTHDGTPRLTDFGLVSATNDVDSRITRTGQVLGTPAYMAPEQATEGSEILTSAADQYALGAVLYELLAGRPPFDGTAMEVLFQLVSESPVSVRQLRPEVPKDLETVLQRAMDQDPERRYASVLAFVEDLERWRRGEPVQARPASAVYRLRLWAWRRRRALTGGAAGLGVALTLFMGFQQAIAWSERRAEAEREAAAEERWAQVANRVDALLSEGRTDEAEASFREFVDEPLHRGTGAVASAWRHRADGQLDAGAVDEAVASYAESYAVAVRIADQVDALRGLARSFAFQWRFDALDTVVQSLDRRGVDDEEVRAWRARAAMERHDVAESRLHLAPDDPRRPLLEAFAAARPLEESHGDRAIDPLGRWMVDVYPDGRVQHFQLDPVLKLVDTLTLGAPLQQKTLLAGGDPLVVVTHDESLDGTATVLEARDGPDGAELVPTVRWPEARLGAALVHDDDLIVGVGPYGRHLVRVDRRSGAVDHPAPSVDEATSDVMSLTRGDLDGDGIDEFVVGTGPWGAYDVRVFDEAWRPLARRKVGVPQDLRVSEGRLYVTDTDQYPSRQLFPVDTPFGDPSAVWVLRLEDGQLVDDGRLVNPVPHAGRGTSLSGLQVADLDGDGREDVVVRSDDQVHGAHAIMWRGLDDGWSEPIVLGDMRPFASADVDGDGDHEVLVDLQGADGAESWVLGSGDRVLPARSVPEVPQSERPPMADEVAVRRWGRAEELVRMGLIEDGAKAIEGLASTTTDQQLIPFAWLRAGRLWEAAGEDDRAAERYQEAAGAPALRTEALDAATLALERTHRFDEALALTQGRDTPTARSVRARLEPLLTGASVFEASSDGLLRELELRDPVALRWEGDGLRADVMADDEPVFTRAMRWDGRRLTLQVVLDLHRVEWAAGLEVRLSGPGDAFVGVYAQGWGGGDLLEHELGCRTSAYAQTLGDRRAVDGPQRATRLTMTMDVVPALGQLQCRVVDDTGFTWVDRQERLRGALPSGDWVLQLQSTKHGGLEIPQVASAVLRTVRVEGSSIEALPKAPTDPLIERSVRGEVEAIAAMVGGSERGPEAVWRVAALADAGRLEAARALLEPIVADPTDEELRECLHLLRSRAAVFAPLLAEVSGRDFAVWFDQAWTGALYAHPRDPSVTWALTTQLGGLERADAIPAGPSARMQRAVLLLARARAWAGQGELGAARRDVRAAERDVDAFLHQIEDERVADVGNRLAATHRMLAVHEARGGRSTAALRHARASLRWSPSRDVGLDGLRATGTLDDVVEQLLAGG